MGFREACNCCRYSWCVWLVLRMNKRSKCGTGKAIWESQKGLKDTVNVFLKVYSEINVKYWYYFDKIFIIKCTSAREAVIVTAKRDQWE